MVIFSYVGDCQFKYYPLGHYISVWNKKDFSGYISTLAEVFSQVLVDGRYAKFEDRRSVKIVTHSW